MNSAGAPPDAVPDQARGSDSPGPDLGKAAVPAATAEPAAPSAPDAPPPKGPEGDPAGGAANQDAGPDGPDGEVVGPIPPDSLTVDEQLGPELFGAGYTGGSRSDNTTFTQAGPDPEGGVTGVGAGTTYSNAKTFGPSAFGNNNTIYNTYGAKSPRPSVGSLRDMADIVHWYAECSADAELDGLLEEGPIVVLAGMRGSGRFSTASAALIRRFGADRAYEICLPVGVAPEALRVDGLVGENRGYVMRLPGDGLVAVRALADLVRRNSSGLVLISDYGPAGSGRRRPDVEHRRPDAVAVFSRQVAWQLHLDRGLSLASANDRAESLLQIQALHEELRGANGPREVVDIVRSICDGHPRGDRALDDSELSQILSASQPRRRARAVRILVAPEDADHLLRQGHRIGQHARAFRLAYAVFARRPMHYVFDSAAWLLAEIDGAALRPDWGRMALEMPVKDLLGAELQQDWSESVEAGTAVAGSARSAWLRDRGLRGAVLEVAWHEFDSTREALLRWLDRLVVDGDETMARAAAETAAVLANNDFEWVHEHLIDRWAASPRPRVRQAAAWTEAIAAMGGQVRHLVRARVAEWCDGKSNHRRDTAARVYASGLQQAVMEWTLAHLRRIATDPMQKSSYAVTEAVSQLYQSRTAAHLIEALRSWVRFPETRLHALRGLLRLLGREGEEGAAGHPDLLTRLADGTVNVDALATVWRSALVESETSALAWDRLVEWLGHADTDQALRKTGADLVTALAVDDRMRRRVSFYLTRLWRYDDGVPLWVRRLLEDSDDRTGQ
jgi:hypothetical protein